MKFYTVFLLSVDVKDYQNILKLKCRPIAFTSYKTFLKTKIVSTDLNTKPGVVACTCNPAALEVEFRNGVASIPVWGNSPLIGGWIV